MIWRCLFYVCLCWLAVDGAPAVEPEVVSVVLLGATGDLAKKYLWQAIFALYVNNRSPRVTFQIFAGARDEAKNGQPKVAQYIKDKTNCKQDINIDISQKECESALEDFAKVWEYQQLKTAADYKALNERIITKTGERVEAGRLFYLSVPPFAYTSIAELVNTHTRAPGNAWTRVVLEKPFGEDLSSAQTMATALATQFKDEEMFRVDHYLGKPGVMAIEEFRYSNRDEFDSIWNKDHIQKVEIVMKEMEDCEGRTGFYDAYGVIRDVHQNHLTQMTALVAMELASPETASNSSYVQSLKDNVLRDMRVLQAPNAVLGQYASYAQHVKADNPKSTSTSTPTWASVVAHIDNPRWEGVPFVMMAGKQLDERTAYVRVIFKQNVLPAMSTGLDVVNPYVLFSVQGGVCDKACVLVSKSLPEPWTKSKTLPAQFDQLPTKLSVTNNGAVRQSGDAYTALLSAVYHNQRDRFVATYNLLRSWEIWTPLLQSKIEPRIYEKPLGNTLDSVLVGNKMAFADGGRCRVAGCPLAEPLTHFRGQPLVTGEVQSVIDSLAKDILSKALASIAQKGVFHLALSGGSTPDLLFHHLAFFVPDFPWQKVHIWQVDERCVDTESSDRNYRTLSRVLLRHVSIPHHQVHPMPVDAECLPEDSQASRYAKELRRYTDVLDYVLLGIGEDGHTASLFPGQIEAEEVSVKLAPGPKGGVKRMTMTFPLLNRASSVAVLVTGKKKRNIVRALADSNVDPQKYPITGVKAPSIVWYLDCDTLVDNEIGM